MWDSKGQRECGTSGWCARIVPRRKRGSLVIVSRGCRNTSKHALAREDASPATSNQRPGRREQTIVIVDARWLVGTNELPELEK